MHNHRSWVSCLSLAIALSLTAVGCERGGEGLQHVQRAVGIGASASLAATSQARVERTPPTTPNVEEIAGPERVPVPVNLDGVGALRFVPDDNHREAQGIRTPAGYAVTWTDRDAHAVYLGFGDRSGRAAALGTRLHASSEGEETLASPCVTASRDGYGVAWVDRDNGRVRFARIDTHGALLGRVAIVHDGVDSPRMARIAWNGREYAIVVTLRSGLYVARLGADGVRVGTPAVLLDEATLHSIETLAWDGRAYEVTFSALRDGHVERRTERIIARHNEVVLAHAL